MSYGFPSTTGGSGFSSAIMDDRNGKKKRPKCAKCRNHGIDVMRVGHKGSCSYEKCDCELCRQTRTRNDAMARTMANERARKKKETGGQPQGRSMFVSSSTPYVIPEKKRTLSFQIQETYEGGMTPYNVGRVTSTTPSLATYSKVPSMETKMFSNTATPYTAFHQKTLGVPSAVHSFVSPVYKMEPIEFNARGPLASSLNAFSGSVWH